MLLTGRLIRPVHDGTLHISTGAHLLVPAKLLNAQIEYCSNVHSRYTELVQSERSVCTDTEFASLILGQPPLAAWCAVLHFPPAIGVIVAGRGFHDGGQVAAVFDQRGAG